METYGTDPRQEGWLEAEPRWVMEQEGGDKGNGCEGGEEGSSDAGGCR